jgi:Chaperone of endosialidase
MNTNHKYVKTASLVGIFLLAVSTGFSQTISDNVIKKNINPISSPLKSLLQLEPKMYEFDTQKYKAFQLKKGLQYGFLAENIQDVFPGMVGTRSVTTMVGKNTYRDSKIQTIDEVSLIPVLVASIKELHMEIELLKQQVQNLKK